MRRVRALIACAGLAGAALCPGAARAADPAPLIVFQAPADSLPEVADARTALNRVAVQRGTALIDLSPAADIPPEAGRHLSRGIEAYHNFRYDEALGYLDAGLAEAAQTGADGLTTSELSDLLLYRALAFTATGDSASAWDEFVKAAVIDPTRQLDPVRFPPRVVETYLRAVDNVIAGKSADVTVDLPGTCSVWVDGRASEPASTLALAWGEHYVRATCPGHLPYGALFAADRDQHTLAPSLARPTKPSLADVRELAAERGARTVIWAVVTVSDKAPPTLLMKLVDVDTGAERGTVTAALGGQSGSRKDIAAAADTLIDQVVAPPIAIVPPPATTPWYKHPVFWGAVGVAVTAAILLPFAIDDSGATGFEVRPGGALPP